MCPASPGQVWSSFWDTVDHKLSKSERALDHRLLQLSCAGAPKAKSSLWLSLRAFHPSQTTPLFVLWSANLAAGPIGAGTKVKLVNSRWEVEAGRKDERELGRDCDTRQAYYPDPGSAEKSRSQAGTRPGPGGTPIPGPTEAKTPVQTAKPSSSRGVGQDLGSTGLRSLRLA